MPRTVGAHLRVAPGVDWLVERRVVVVAGLDGGKIDACGERAARGGEAASGRRRRGRGWGSGRGEEGLAGSGRGVEGAGSGRGVGKRSAGDADGATAVRCVRDERLEVVAGRKPGDLEEVVREDGAALRAGVAERRSEPAGTRPHLEGDEVASGADRLEVEHRAVVGRPAVPRRKRVRRDPVRLLGSREEGEHAHASRRSGGEGAEHTDRGGDVHRVV